jgi:streptogramin lyase
MRFWQSLRHGTLDIVSVFVLVTLTILPLRVSAQPAVSQTAPTATPEPAWDAAETAEADADGGWTDDTAEVTSTALTLVWQTAFTPEASLPSPGDIAIDSDGNVYVSTQGANGVKKYDKDGNFVMGWGGSGKGDGQFALSLGIDVDSDNNVYVSDFYHRRIQKFDSEGTFLMQWATAPKISPAFLTIDAQDNVYIDLFPPAPERYVQKFDTWGTLISERGNDDQQFGGRIEDIAVDADGNLYLADALRHCIRKLDPEGKLVATFGGEMSSEGNGLFDEPLGITVDPDGYIFVLDRSFLQKLDAEGKSVAQWTVEGGDLDKASNVASDAEGNIYVFAHADVKAANGNTVNVPVLKKFQQTKS